MAFERKQLAAGGAVPHPRRSVRAARDDSSAIRRKPRSEDLPHMAFERQQLLPGCRVPHHHAPIVATGENSLAVRGECHGVDLIGVPPECE